MTRAKRLDTILRLAADRERDAAGALARSRGQVAAEEQRLDMLLGYRAEYEERFQVSGAGGMDIRRLQEYRAFLDRIGRAIEHQRQVLATAQQHMDLERQRWLDETRRAQSLGRVQERLRDTEQRSADAREQRETDERAGAVTQAHLSR
jgi:flagellar FliJ protein